MKIGHSHIFKSLLLSLLLFFGSAGTISAAFTFTAVGDYLDTTDTDNVLTGIRDANVNFHLALGDFNHDSNISETTWCNYVKSFVGPEFPHFPVSPSRARHGSQTGCYFVSLLYWLLLLHTDG